MKPVVIIAIAVGVSVVAVVGVLIGVGVYQQAQLEKEQREANQAFIDLLQKVAESKQDQSQRIQEETPQFYDCVGSAGCFTDYVTRITDGDTIYTNTLKIRLSLTNTPEINQLGFSQATRFTENLCPVGSSILVDQDDLQPVDDYGRVLAKVYCGDRILNSELLYNGYADILTQYCSTSEFSGEAWAQEYGCGSKEIQSPTPSPQTNENNCDPSYPDTCIPSLPPDLDCGDIQFSNFKVLQPDPHRFDGDKDGIGCEK
ncbi:MAG: thermonuclease family protein [Nitrosopumilaceae archaeon]